MWRSAEYLPQELVFNINYLGADQASFTLNFSKGASQVIGQYYQMVRLGKKGYKAIMSNLTRTANYLSESLKALDYIIMSQQSGKGLPLVAFRLKPDEERGWDEFALAHKLRARGWVVPAYTMAPHTKNLKMLRVVVREDFTKNRCDALITDIKLCTELLETMDKDAIKKQEEFLRKHAIHSTQARHNHPRFRVSVGFEIFLGQEKPLTFSCRRRSIRYRARRARLTASAKTPVSISTLLTGNHYSILPG